MPHLDLRSALSVPALFRLFKRAIGADNVMATFVRDHARPKAGHRVLDIGCGLGDVLEYFPDEPVDYLGLDASAAYVASARERYGARARFAEGRVGEITLDEPGSFDLVLAVGVLHHLDDGEARRLLELGRGALKPGGRLASLDGCYTGDQSRLARLIVSRDRGAHVRSEADYLELAGGCFGRVESHILHDMLRIPYTHIILECEA